MRSGVVGHRAGVAWMDSRAGGSIGARAGGGSSACDARRSLLVLAVVARRDAGARPTSRSSRGTRPRSTSARRSRSRAACSASTARRSSCLLAFEPTFNRFTAVVQAKDFKRFPPERARARATPAGACACTGTIEIVDSKPEIVVDEPDDLAAGRRRGRSGRAARGARPRRDRRTRSLDRLDDDARPGRGADRRGSRRQERMERCRRSARRRASQRSGSRRRAAAGAAEPTFGEPQPRPGYEALRTVKRGMTRERGRAARRRSRIDGRCRGGNGWTTWDYGYGRSVTLRRPRPRARRWSGFPAP